MRLLLLNSLFLLATGGAWAWYHVDPPQPPVRYSFHAREKVPGYQFKSEPVSEMAASTLATTNLLNGTFYGPKGERITAFLGEWSAANSKEMSVVSHTPDVCWVGAGWMPVYGEHPDQMDFDLAGTKLPFEIRTFSAPGGNHRELTVWCTLVNGQVYSELNRFAPPDLGSDIPKQRMAVTSRRLAGGQFLNAVRSRTAGVGDKQFVRFSATVAGDWQPVLRDLQVFAKEWLGVEEDGEAAKGEGREAKGGSGRRRMEGGRPKTED